VTRVFVVRWDPRDSGDSPDQLPLSRVRAVMMVHLVTEGPLVLLDRQGTREFVAPRGYVAPLVLRVLNALPGSEPNGSSSP
jgi:hypothetical protein